MDQVFVGIDIAKESFVACALNEKQEKLFELTLPMDREGFQKLEKHLRDFPKESLLIGEESSGCYHINLFSFLVSQGYRIVVLNPLLVSHFLKLSLRKTKTDRKDALTIAQFLAQFHTSLPESSFLSSDFRDLARERESISFEITRLKNDIQRLLEITFPELPRYLNVFSSSLLNLLQLYPSARAIKAADPVRLAEVLKNQGKGRKPAISPEELLSLAKVSIASPSPSRELILSQKISHLLFLQEKLPEIEEMLSRMCRQIAWEDLEILKSIKGIGDVTALHFLAEVGDVRRFGNHRKLIAYAGLDPSVHQSGKFKGESKISKRGNRHARRVIFLMAQSVARVNHFFRTYFLRKREEGASYKKAILAVAHKLIRVIFALLTQRSHFRVSLNS